MSPRSRGRATRGFKVAFHRAEGCLEARVSGRLDSPADTLALFQRIGAELRRAHAPLVLVLDESQGVVPDAAEFGQIIAELHETGLRDVRLAYVDLGVGAIERIEVGELLAHEAGYALRTFKEEGAARLWLRYGSGDASPKPVPEVAQTSVDTVLERDYRIDFSLDLGCLRAYVIGHNGGLQTTLEYWREIGAELRRLRPSMLLVVDVMDGGPPAPEQLKLFVESMQADELRGMRIAYVEDKFMSIPKVELAGIYAIENDYDVQIFDDEHTAARWLRYGLG